MTQETEIKLRVDGVEGAVGLLERQGFVVLHPRIFERNLIFDTPRRELKAAKKLLRLRDAGGVVTLTFKGPATTGKHKSREEREVHPDSFDEMRVILERLGYQESFRYEKHRTEFHRAGEQGIATVDETPAGTFMELEGEAAWIDRMAAAMGFREADYITASYATLYREAGVSGRYSPTETVPSSLREP